MEIKPSTAPNPVRRVASNVASPTKRKSNPRKLTPQFHWNLNDVSQQCLEEEDNASLYQLFRFYDSSLEGDTLPAIHFDRFVELLRDADLLASGDAFSEGDDELQIVTVERVFAQAVLGKLRTYLDAEAEPALIFRVFCGALFNCAMVKFPEITPPEAAYRKLVAQLLHAQPREGHLSSIDAARGLVQHPEHASIPSWSVEDLHRHLPSDPPDERFLDRDMFQQVLSGLCHDKQLDDRLRERLESHYMLPDEHLAFFNAETIAFVTDRFRTFDVFDRGVIPRDEVFALLSGMAKKLEITDVYEVIAVILAGAFGDHKQMPRGSLVLTAPSAVKEVSLPQVMQALYVCRRSRSASYLTTQQSHSRKAGGVAAALAKNSAASNASAVAVDLSKVNDPEKKTVATHSSGKSEKRKGKAGTSSHKGSLGSPAKTSMRSGNSSQASKRGGAKKEKKMSSSDVGIPRRPSKLTTSSNDPSGVAPTHDSDDDIRSTVNGESLVRQDSFKSSSSTSSARTVRVPSVIAAPEAAARAAIVPRMSVDSVQDTNNTGQELDVSSKADTSIQQSLPALTLRMFRIQNDLRPDSLDGAICVIFELFLSPPSRVVESQGIYYASNGNRHEVWQIQTHSIDDHLPMEAAVVFAKRLIVERERDRFTLLPELPQREAVEKLIRDIRDARSPPYAAALHGHERKSHLREEQQGTPNVSMQENGFRRGGLFVRSSLERGSTWVRQKSSSDLLAILSDSMLQKKLKMKKRQSILASSNSGLWRTELASSADKSPLPTAEDRSSGKQQKPNYGQQLTTWGLIATDDWITSLDHPNRRVQLSQSLPALLHGARPTKLEPLERSDRHRVSP